MELRLSLTLALTLFASASVSAEPPPISAFARQPQVRDAAISPDGRYLVTVASVNGQRVAMTLDLQAPPKFKPVLTVKPDDNVDIKWCRWGNDTRVVCALATTLQGQRYTYSTSRLAAVDADGSNVKELMKNLRVDSAVSKDDVLDWTLDDPITVLGQARENVQSTGTLLTVSDTTPAVFKLDIYSGAMQKISNPQPSIRNYKTDGNGAVRLGYGVVGTKRLYFARVLGDDTWRKLAKVEAFAATNELLPQFVVPGTNKAYAFGWQDDRRSLWEIDLEDKAEPRLVFAHPKVDIDLDGLAFEELTGKLLSYSYETDRPFVQYEDERLASIMVAVNKALPNTFNRAVSWSQGIKKVVIESTSDVEAGAYYVFDSVARKLQGIDKAYPELKAVQLARMRTIEYPAQDGTLIPGYLTVPLNTRPEKLPLVVLPHGGPIARDSWRFNFLQQFLVSRGYAVLQMNFRGSAGYGQAWFDAAHQDWGGLTYSDITDGAKWAVAQGIADPQRMCIVGWSFGGYSALLGATRNSDLYKCAVSIAGIGDLAELVQTARDMDRGNRYVAEKEIGYDTDKLKKDSPARNAKGIAIPVLLIHGNRDAQVQFEQATNMEKALRSAGKKYEFVKIDNAGHQLLRESERTVLLTKIEDFLKTNLGANAPPPPSVP